MRGLSVSVYMQNSLTISRFRFLLKASMAAGSAADENRKRLPLWLLY